MLYFPNSITVERERAGIANVKMKEVSNNFFVNPSKIESAAHYIAFPALKSSSLRERCVGLAEFLP